MNYCIVDTQLDKPVQVHGPFDQAACRAKIAGLFVRTTQAHRNHDIRDMECILEPNLVAIRHHGLSIRVLEVVPLSPTKQLE